MYAVVETGGKQYKVSPGQVIDVELLGTDAGEQVTLDRVLLISDGEQVTVGQPMVEGVKVLATVKEEHKARKVVIWKYRPRDRYRLKKGHRQRYTRLQIDEIVV